MQKIRLVFLATTLFVGNVLADQSTAMRMFGQCLVLKGVHMYTASWCPYCFAQLKEMDGSLKRSEMESHEKMSAFPFLVECTGVEPYTIQKGCLPKGARGVPMWTFPRTPPLDEGGDAYTGGQLPLTDIAAYSGCPLPETKRAK